MKSTFSHSTNNPKICTFLTHLILQILSWVIVTMIEITVEETSFIVNVVVMTWGAVAVVVMMIGGILDLSPRLPTPLATDQGQVEGVVVDMVDTVCRLLSFVA